MLTIEECCGHRPPEYPHTDVAHQPELHDLLVQLPDDPQYDFTLWQCQHCGQLWREYIYSAGELGDPVVIKDDMVPVPAPVPVLIPVPEADSRLPIGDTVGVVGLILGGLGLVVGIVRLPSEYDSLPWELAWVLGHVAAGVGIAVMMLVMLILRRKARERAR